MLRLDDALEYKYVVRKSDGTVLYWKPGDNIRLEIEGGGEGSLAVQEVVVGDAWDGKSQSVRLVPQPESTNIDVAAAAGRIPVKNNEEKQQTTAEVLLSSADSLFFSDQVQPTLSPSL